MLVTRLLPAGGGVAGGVVTQVPLPHHVAGVAQPSQVLRQQGQLHGAARMCGGVFSLVSSQYI